MGVFILHMNIKLKSLNSESKIGNPNIIFHQFSFSSEPISGRFTANKEES